MNYPPAQQLVLIGGPRAKPPIVGRIAMDLPGLAPEFGLDRLHRLAHFLSQTAHESAGFSTTTEFASGVAYEGRIDLGNTQPGDGKKFRGHGLIQTTGRANHREFTRWAKARGAAPDFETEPDSLATFPWALLSALFYWDSRRLSALADDADVPRAIENITRKINGGLNGLADRRATYDRAALVLLGYGLTDAEVRRFQRAASITADGEIGPQTRGAFHKALVLAAEAPPAGDPPPPEDEPPADVEARLDALDARVSALEELAGLDQEEGAWAK